LKTAPTIGDSVYTIDVSLTLGAYNGGTFAVGNQLFDVFTNGVNTVNIIQVGQLPFTNLHDDDDDALLPYSTPPLGFLGQILSNCYIVVASDGGGNMSNNKLTVPFVSNVYDPNAIMSSANAFESSGNRTNDYWIVWLCSAHQPVTTPGENYGTTPLGGRADGDPDSEKKLVAIAPYGGALLFRESIRDGGAAAYGLSTNAIEPPLIAHELGHAFGLIDLDKDSNPVNQNSIMGKFWLSNGFAPMDIETIRKRTNSPGM